MREWDQKDTVSILLGKSFWSCGSPLIHKNDIIETPGVPGPQSENHYFSCYAVEIRTLSICSVRLTFCNPWSSSTWSSCVTMMVAAVAHLFMQLKYKGSKIACQFWWKKRERPIPCPNRQHPLPWESVSSTCNVLPPLNSFPHRAPRTFFSFRKSDHVTLSS